MPDNVAQSTSNNISGSGYNTRQRWRGSDSAEKWSRTEADRGRWGMASSESSKLPLNHILSAPPIPLTWGDCPGHLPAGAWGFRFGVLGLQRSVRTCALGWPGVIEIGRKSAARL